MRKVFILSLFSIGYLLAGCSKDGNLQKTPSAGKDLTIGKNKSTETVSAIGAAGIAGVNWADGRDNFVDGWVIPSGLTASDSYSTVSAKANAILTAFKTNMPGVNTVRLPINPNSVLEAWWGSYNGAIDAALGKNMKVILGCWEGASSKNGLVDDTAKFWSMWQTVVTKYGANSNVYFEVFNEPHGYSLSALTTLYAEWLSRFPNVPKGQILLGGVGYSENVTGVGADSRFSSCLLSLHNYAYWATRTQADWETDWRNRIGSYGSRTVVTEFGAAMTTGKNYNGAVGSDNEIAYMVGSTNVFRNDQIASVYWPGLRDNDSYSVQTRGGSGNNITLTTTNSSGVDRIRYGWGEFNSNAFYRIINRNSGKAADVNGASTVDGASVIQWTYSGGNNQQWQVIDNGNGYYKVLNRNSGKALDINGASVTDGASVIQWQYNLGNNQQWQIVNNGSGYYKILNRNSGKALDVNQNSLIDGANLIQWPWNGGNNQQWQIIQQ